MGDRVMLLAAAFLATSYTADCPGCTGVTATGLVADYRLKLMAVDPDVLELGRCYLVQRQDGREDVYLAADTGPRGQHVDLLVQNVEQARRFGRQLVNITGPVECPDRGARAR